MDGHHLAGSMDYRPRGSFPDLCCFQGDLGRDSQQRGPKGETGDIGPMVRCPTVPDSLCQGPRDTTQAGLSPAWRPREWSLRLWTRNSGAEGPWKPTASPGRKSLLGTEPPFPEGLLCGTGAAQRSRGRACQTGGLCGGCA